MDLLERGDEIKSATRALAHALKTRKDLDIHTRRRISSLIERAKKVGNRTTEQAIQDLIRESSDINELFTTQGFGQSGALQGGTISGMEPGQRGRESQLSPRDEQFMQEFQRISSEAQRAARELSTATPEQARVLNRRLLELSGEQDRVVESRHSISRGELVKHPAFVQAVQEGYRRMNASGRLRFSPQTERDAINYAIQGIEGSGNAATNPYSRMNPIGSNREEYQVLLNQGVIQSAYDAARRALLDERISNVRATIPSSPLASPAVEPGTSAPAQDASNNPAEATPVTPASAHEVTPPATPATEAAHHPQAPGAMGQPGVHPSVPIHTGGAPVYQTFYNNYANGQNGAPQIPGVIPATTPAPHAPGHGHEAAPGHAAHGAPEAAPQNSEALRNRYWDINRQEDAAFAELKAHIDMPDRKEKLAVYERLMNQRKALAEQILAPYGGREAAMRVARQEVAAEAAERGQHAPTATEARNALGAIQGRTRAEAARIVAEKTGGDQNKIRRWLSAFVRWPAAVVSGMASGIVGYSFTQTGLAGGITSLATSMGVPASWLGAGALGSIPATVGGIAVPFVGGLAIPAIPVILTALAGVGIWQYARRGTFFKTWDDNMNTGWQAKKLYNRMRRGDSQEAIDAKYAKISKRPTWLRMQTVPRIFGTLLGGMAMHDLVSLSKGGSVQDLVLRRKGLEAVELGKKIGGAVSEKSADFWNNPKVQEWFKFGGGVQQGTPQDTAHALAGMPFEHDVMPRPDVEGARALSDLVAERANTEEIRQYVADLEAENQKLRLELAAQVAPLPEPDPTPIPPPVEPEPAPTVRPRIVETPPAPSSEAVILETSPLFKLKPSDLTFVVNESSEVKNIPQGLRRFFDSLGFKGRSTEWLIDTIDKTTYNGNGVRPGQDLMYDLTGTRVRPTAIPDGTKVDLAEYLRKGMNAQNLYARIDATSALTGPDKLSLKAFVDRLEEVARRPR